MATYRTPEGKLRAACVLRARQGGFGADWVRKLASLLFDVPAVEGMSLSLLDRDQLIRLRRRIGEILGETPGARRPADPDRRPRGLRTPGRRQIPGVVRMASVAQLQMIEGLRQELHLGTDELEGIVRRATQGRTVHARITADAHVVIEALLAIRGRRERSIGQSAQRTAEGES